MLKSDHERMLNGEVIFSGGNGYMICAKCNRIIKCTGIFGSMHLCSEDTDE